MKTHLKMRALFLLLSIGIFCHPNASAQYFGRNKVLYQNFDFRVLQSPHFEFYTYLPEGAFRNRFLQRTEQWYSMHQRVLRDTFKERNPFILYNSHAHFQQTRAIEGQIDVGTGGVTEGLKNRVIMPVMESWAQTDHVLGHELVHAFQYHLIKDSFSLNALNNLPLWMVEGMAEYMSTGYRDAHTAMWLRSGVAAERLPTLRDLTTRPDLYFPYRWGEAFWAYVSGRWGDDMIRRLFMETARRGYNEALKRLVNMDEKEFSRQWQEAIRTAYAPIRQRTSATAPGTNLIGEKGGGRLNVVPSISPDGRYLAFWSEKNLFSIDLFLADAATGEIRERITTNAYNSHVDQYSSYESAVAWSPDSRRIAFVAFAKGRNRLLIATLNGDIKEEIDLPGVSSFSNPTWSPDGKTIVVNGLVEGQSDLFAYSLDTKAVRRLTNDSYSDFQPQFSPDGQTIAFATDRLGGAGAGLQGYSHNIALYHLQTGEITNLDFFPGANNLNPYFGADPSTIYFLSDRDGLRNLYTYHLQTKQLTQLTNLFIGITGITLYSPAVSVSRSTGEVVYSYFVNNRHFINKAKGTAFQNIPVASDQVDIQAALMPPFERVGPDIVQNNLLNPPQVSTEQQRLTEVAYRPKFQLDYIGSTGVGVQTGGPFGTGLAGGVNGIFSDILGNNQLFGAISLNGEIYDLAGQFAYLNQKNRLNWGVGISHIPFVSGAQYLYYDSLKTDAGDKVPVLNSSVDLLRTFQDQVTVYASYPFSTIRRIEVGSSFARYYYRVDRYTEYYDETGQFYMGGKRERQPAPSGFNFGQVYTALVGDNSSFGVAAPLVGSRYRLEAAQYLGVVNLTNLTADYRKYFRMAPLTFATRNLFMGRFGREKESGALPPLYIGYPFLIRGYDAIGYTENTSQSKVSINDLIGSSMYVANAELRLPFTGPERLSAIKSSFLFTELNLFTDGGIAWGNRNLLSEQDAKGKVQRSSRFIMSSGVSLRVNLFGALVLEPYYAIPWQNGGLRNASFGLNFTPGF